MKNPGGVGSGFLSIPGGKLKEEGFEHWNDPNTDVTNESAFQAISGSARHYSEGIFMEVSLTGTWWSAYLMSVTK